MAGLSEADLRAIFDEFDADRSGEISSSELTNALTKVFADDSSKSAADISALAEAVIAEADTNHDSKISWEEFKKAATS